MKRIHYYILGVVILIAVTILSSWAGSHHSAKTLNETINTNGTKVHLALKDRYSAIDTIISEVESTDSTITGHVATIKNEHTKFNTYLTDKSFEEIYEVALKLDTTFVTLISVLESNRDKYTPFTITTEVYEKYQTSTRSTISNIETFNESVDAYNTNLKVFPNVIYLSFFAPKNNWDKTPYHLDLPNFA